MALLQRKCPALVRHLFGRRTLELWERTPPVCAGCCRLSSTGSDGRDGQSTRRRESLLKYFNRNVKMWGEEMMTKLRSPNLDTMFDQNRVLWHFRGPESVDDFSVQTDKDIGGRSTAALSVSRNNKLLFHGNLCTEVPRDGETARSGYCAIRSKQVYGSFNRKLSFDLSPFNVLRMRVRGDGRAYMVNLIIKGYFTDTHDDVWSYFMFTRGGPYWQDVSIPFTKFFMSSKGRVQDKQTPPDLESVTAVGLTMADAVDGEFALEIDSISVSFDATHTEQYTYEMYN
ncbi:complex I intermediate-associated protein 30, mitochondrial-like [Diadema antillarum]|uniref:complex I intermediate-associated protein 30, mitochondrial-like n=1 Tax=Diadema antillarum TaxID=105358 RepID=UPI003A8C831A